jgi:uncharacterized membrane protein YfcA
MPTGNGDSSRSGMATGDVARGNASHVERRPGATARRVNDRPVTDRVRLDAATIRKLVVLLAAYVSFVVLLDTVLAVTFLPTVVVLAFVFELTDSAAGMGFGTALVPSLFVLGYDPLTVTPPLLVSEAVTGLLAGGMHREFRNANYSLSWPPNAETRLVGVVVGIGVAAVADSVVLTYLVIDPPDAIIEGYVGLLVLAMGLIGVFMQYLIPVSEYRPTRLYAFVALAGVNKGIGGGGFGPVVTLGQVYAGVYEKTATAITTAAEGIISVAGALAFFAITFAGVELDFVLLPSLLAGSLPAGIVAPYFVRVVPNRVFRYLLPTYAFVVGIVLLLRLYVL